MNAGGTTCIHFDNHPVATAKRCEVTLSRIILGHPPNGGACPGADLPHRVRVSAHDRRLKISLLSPLSPLSIAPICLSSERSIVNQGPLRILTHPQCGSTSIRTGTERATTALAAIHLQRMSLGMSDQKSGSSQFVELLTVEDAEWRD